MSQSKGIGPLIKNKLFAGVNAQAIRMNLLQSNFLSFKEGDIIFQAGDKSDNLYLIIDGGIKLKIISSANSSTVREKGKNDFFGDYELLDNIPRKSSAVANTDCVFYKLSQKEFFDLTSTHKAVKDTVLAERSENTSNIKNSAHQFMQAVMGLNGETSPALEPVNETELSENILPEETTEIENGNKDLSNDTYEFTAPLTEDTPLSYENEIPIIDDDEDLSSGNAFSAALNDDMIFREAPVSSEVPPIEEKPALNIFEPEYQKEKLPVLESFNGEMDFQKMLFAVKKIHENIELDKTVRSIIEAIFALYDAQIVRIFLLDKNNIELWSFPFMDNTDEIKKVKIGEGLIGRCASDNEIINIINPDNDIRFNPTTDTVEGIILEDMLLLPILDKDKNVVAVVQMINSGKDGFTRQDEEILCILSPDICTAIEKTYGGQNKIEKENFGELGNITDFIIDDINTPLSLIRRYAEFIRKKTDVKEVRQVSEFISEQVNSVLTYSGIVSDFINRKSSLKREVIDLQITLNNILDMFAEYVESRNAKLFKKLEADTRVFLDADVFYHACFQLIKNACSSMPEGGNIYVTAKKEGNFVFIEFRNTGKGIGDEMRDKISKSLTMPDNEGRVGLSLSIANKIIKDHGGEIKIGSETTEGASFIISLPIHSVLKD